MARDVTVELCGLSIDASPHPPGVYVQLLRQGSSVLVQARGSDYAKITNPRRYEGYENIYTGRVLVWTDIQLKGKWLDLRNEAEIDQRILDQINIPPNAKPNYRSFTYVFDDEAHQFWFESKNDLGDTIGPRTMQRIVTHIVTAEGQAAIANDVEVSLIPEPGALRRILALPRLQRITIRVARPNPDYASPAAKQRIEARLSRMHAQRMEVTVTKSAAATRLTLDDDLTELAEVGGDIGFVKGTEIDADGNRKTVSTTNVPQRLFVDPDVGGSAITRMLRTLGRI